MNPTSGASAPNVAVIPTAIVPEQVANAFPFPTQPQESLVTDSNGVASSGLAAEQFRSAPASTIPPGAAPEPIRIQKSRSRKNSASAPKDLDKIDELDETDPLGYAWHHESPYEAIRRAVDSGLVPGDGADHNRGKPKIFVSDSSYIMVGYDSNIIIRRLVYQAQWETIPRYDRCSYVYRTTLTFPFLVVVIAQEPRCGRSQSYQI